MNKTNILNSIKRTIGTAELQLKKHSPEILMTIGIAGTVASFVLACVATTKINPIVEQASADIDAIHDCKNNKNAAEEYTDKDAAKELIKVYSKTGIKLLELYSPAIIIGTLSLTSIICSNNVLKKRNVALASAYASVDKCFKDYKKRVAEKYGEDAEKELRLGFKSMDIAEEITDENGEKKVVTNTVGTVEHPEYSPFFKVFDEYNDNWKREAEYNKMFLTNVQNWANDILKSRGHIFLNEVYEALGYEKTKAGMVVGWIYDENNPIGDNYVDFGLYDFYRQRVCDFDNGYEYSIVLDFNVDGNIFEFLTEDLRCKGFGDKYKNELEYAKV